MAIAIPIPGRGEIIRAFRATGGSIAAVLPIHYPRALLRAFGLLPVEVWGPPGIDAAPAASQLQPYVCSIVRNALAFLRSGGLDEVDVIVVPHACDALQGLGSILLDFVQPRQLVLPLYLPRGSRVSDEAFLEMEIESVYRTLGRSMGRWPSDDDLLACIEGEEAADRLLAEVSHRRAHLGLSDAGLYRVLRSREYLPSEAFSALAQRALDDAGTVVRPGTPILLSGIVPEPMGVLDIIAEAGGVIAADDLACCGRRLYGGGRGRNPFARMARDLLTAAPDAMRGSSIQRRLDHLLALCRSSGARGVVFYGVKFCEPELFDLPDLRAGLQAAGIPSISIEVDLSDSVGHQTRTRIEAFLEMIA